MRIDRFGKKYEYPREERCKSHSNEYTYTCLHREKGKIIAKEIGNLMLCTMPTAITHKLRHISCKEGSRGSIINIETREEVELYI